MLWKEHDMKTSLFIAMKCTDESAVDDKDWNLYGVAIQPWKCHGLVQTNCSILWNFHRQFNHYQLQLASHHFITYILAQFIIKWHGYVQNSVFIRFECLLYLYDTYRLDVLHRYQVVTLWSSNFVASSLAFAGGTLSGNTYKPCWKGGGVIAGRWVGCIFKW